MAGALYYTASSVAPPFSLLLAAVEIGIASLMLTGSVMIAVDLIAVAGVWWAVSA